MSLIEYFKNDCVAAHSDAPDKESLLREIARLAKKSPLLHDVEEETILRELLRRESIGSTGFQEGIAIPHCLLPDVTEFTVGLITHRTGVDFKSIDRKPAHIIPFIIGASDKRSTHIRLLSAISRIVSDPHVRSELLTAESPVSLAESFLRNLGSSFSEEKSPGRNLITVHIQDESLFTDILQLFSEADDCYLSVIEASDCSEHLNTIPLFAAFWSGEGKGFHRIITASMKHSASNDMLRRLDTLAGGFEGKTGIMIHMQELLYSAGSLEI
jgi:mannitol/fructose-specific phosphotransferase system IIA component (Ntr-type)